jgi:hypothetical protein
MHTLLLKMTQVQKSAGKHLIIYLLTGIIERNNILLTYIYIQHVDTTAVCMLYAYCIQR